MKKKVKKSSDAVTRLNNAFAELEVGDDPQGIRDERVVSVKMSERTMRRLAQDNRMMELMVEDKQIWGAKVILSKNLPYGRAIVRGCEGGIAETNLWYPKSKPPQENQMIKWRKMDIEKLRNKNIGGDMCCDIKVVFQPEGKTWPRLTMSIYERSGSVHEHPYFPGETCFHAACCIKRTADAYWDDIPVPMGLGAEFAAMIADYLARKAESK